MPYSHPVQSIFLAQPSEGRGDSEKQPKVTKGDSSETMGNGTGRNPLGQMLKCESKIGKAQKSQRSLKASYVEAE